MSVSVRSGASFLLRLVSLAAILFGLGLAGAALMVESGELQVLFGLMAAAGLLIVLVGGALMALGALLRRKKTTAAAPPLTPEQQQRLDAQEFLASRRSDHD